MPALLTGNAVLYKPSEFATLTGIEIGKLLHRSGVPQHIFAVLVGGGAVGSELIKQPIDGVFFTGSYATGQRIAREVGPRMLKLQLELGGKDPIYVREDVDVATAAASLADGAMYNTGQSCCSVERIYVHQTIYEDFVSAFVKEVAGFKRGDPTADDTYIGPLTRAADRRARTASGRRRRQGCEAAPRRNSPAAAWPVVCADCANQRRSLDGGDARGKLRPDYWHSEGGER